MWRAAVTVHAGTSEAGSADISLISLHPSSGCILSSLIHHCNHRPDPSYKSLKIDCHLFLHLAVYPCSSATYHTSGSPTDRNRPSRLQRTTDSDAYPVTMPLRYTGSNPFGSETHRKKKTLADSPSSPEESEDKT